MNAGDGYWTIVTWEAGNVGEKIKYWIPGQRPTRSERKMKQDIRKQKQNDGNAIRHLNRLLNVNFPASKGIGLVLTYDDQHLHELSADPLYEYADPDQWDIAYENAEHQLQLFLRRCRRKCAAAGIEFRYIAITSDLKFSGKIQDYVHCRPHHHVVINPEAAEICLKEWHMGQAMDRRLDSEPDHYGLAEYLLKQVRRVREHKARFTPSKNLKKPKESPPRFAPSDHEVQPPRGASLLFRSPYQPGRPQYIRYIMPAKRKRTEDI